MDTVQRLQREDEEDLGSSVASSARSNFLVESLRQSIDMPAYMQWQTLSTDVSNKLRIDQNKQKI
ncbi:hypothetical protein QR98_0001180 [Sarcoptes scabiei]|uniref:Uncharacterized protein n=1 Tax=Sarcoptes scabiei TaxID=52283 RepID=A0A131ZTA7_SARSC|nr:hypothetical protein QR98_0001180 [Sarcoptes scabiei]